MKNYDVIVVGAGNGGLVAAATTAQAGYKTLLLEKHNIPGGCATSIVRGRFEFEIALHELCNESTSDELANSKRIFADLGATVDLMYEDTLFRAISKGKDGYDLTLHAGKEAFLDDMEKAVPGCRQSVSDFFDLIGNIDDAQKYMNSGKNGMKMNPFVLMSKYGDFMRTASHTVDEVEEALGIPPKARSILNTYWGYLGVPTDDLNALHYISLLTAYCIKKPTMPFNRSYELSLSLAETFAKYGGEVRYNSEVTSFLFDEDGKATGVVVNGEEIYAKKIVANIFPCNVLNRAKTKKIPKKFTKLANARVKGMSFATIYLGLDRSMEELGLKDYSTFISIDNDTRVQYENRQNFGMYVVNCLNKALPNSSPKGTCTLFFTIPYMEGDIPENLTAREYKEYKNALAEKYIKDYEKTIGVSIMPYIEEIVTATPVTMARYLGTPAGAIYGYQVEKWDNIIGRFAMESMEYNIPNLYFCGGHGSMGDGFPSGYITGDKAGKAVVKALKEGK